MKKTLILALTVLSFQSAFADGRDMGRHDGRDIRNDDLPMCLKNLDNANRTISDLRGQLMDTQRRCDQRGRDDHGRNDGDNGDLRRENQRLNDLVNNLTTDNRRLLDENNDLRRQITDMQNDRNGHTLGFFSYAGCQDYTGKIDLKYIVSAEGRMALESETVAKQKVASTYTCSYGIVVGKTEEIRFTQSNNFCVAGCIDYTGNVDQKYIQTGTGRNETEAQFNALKAVAAKYTCSYGIQVQACQ